MDFLLTESPLPYAHIYFTKHLLIAIVDHEDLEWAQQWLWDVKYSKRGPNRKTKAYAVRSVKVGSVHRTLYLHKEIMRRTGKRRPSAKHRMVDHKNGNSLDCRRSNLRWATASMNRRNV